jgi:arginyl-tRNA synthetase
VITGDLDAELIAAARAIAGRIPPDALPATGATWRPAPDGDPAGYATSLPFELARRAGREPADLAAALAAALAEVDWIAAARPTGNGYLTITVTGPALGSVAARIAAAGAGCARSDALAGTAAAVPPWPDLDVAQTWRQAWTEQAHAMAGRLAEAAGAAVSGRDNRDNRDVTVPGAARPAGPPSPVAAAVRFFGTGTVRYRLARTLAGRVDGLTTVDPGRDEYAAVQLAHAESASTMRWAAELALGDEPGPAAGLLDAAAERALLGLLSWFPLRVAAAARRARPAELPRYLEQVAVAWTDCRLACPALPFGGAAAPGEPALRAARLQLADAVRTVLAAGLALTGIEPAARTGATDVS